MPQTVRSDNTRRLMLLAAERLFAEDGIEAVTLRDIGRAAGQRNNSVVHYHFGTKEALVQAAIASRFVAVNDERMTQLDRLAGDGSQPDVRDIVRTIVDPLAALLTVDDEGQPLALLAQLIALPRLVEMVTSNEAVVGSTRRAGELLARASALPAPVFRFRFNVALLTLVQTLAAAERQLRAGTGELPPKAVFVECLIDAMCGLLTAPVSAAACAAGALVPMGSHA